MKFNTLTLLLLSALGAGCTIVAFAPVVAVSDLPNCFDTNYDEQRDLFTIKKAVGDQVNQQCLLTLWPPGGEALVSRPVAGRYRIYLANGGGGGAGGTALAVSQGGGGGGGGAGAKEIQVTVDLAAGAYKLTIGAGGLGGGACVVSRTSPGGSEDFGGGLGWLGSPSSMVRVATGEVIAGVPGADRYVRPTRGQNERIAGEMDGSGGSGPGQASGGDAGRTGTREKARMDAEAGDSKGAPGGAVAGGTPGYVHPNQDRVGAGGGGGATSVATGGTGGGQMPSRRYPAILPPERGSLGSGGGGGEASAVACDPGARGGDGYIALRPI